MIDMNSRFHLGTLLEPYHVVKMLEEYSAAKKKLSLARFSHTEIGYASLPYNLEWTEKIEFFSRYCGVDEDEVDRELIKDKLIEAIKEADIVGFNYAMEWTDFDNECAVVTYELLNRMQYFPRYYTSPHISVEMAQFPMFWEWLRTQRAAIVGRLYKKGKKVFKKNGVNVTFTSDLEGYQQTEHVFQKLLDAAADWDVAIIAAGVPASILAPKIAKAANKIAIDFGSAMNKLTDKNYHFDEAIKEWKEKNKK